MENSNGGRSPTCNSGVIDGKMSVYLENRLILIPKVGVRGLLPLRRLGLHELRDREEETVRP
jgi:hypothetical protein